MADVDHFKRFNDEYGHEIGDTALKTVAKTLEYCCRSYDLPGRWGGEEFVVLAGKGTPEGVQALADRVRALVAESTLNRAGQWLQVTVSLGATIARDDDDEASLVARADELMYQSKSAGRNRVTFGM